MKKENPVSPDATALMECGHPQSDFRRGGTWAAYRREGYCGTCQTPIMGLTYTIRRDVEARAEEKRTLNPGMLEELASLMGCGHQRAYFRDGSGLDWWRGGCLICGQPITANGDDYKLEAL